ncbi:PLP-dependent aminotransferase family protein [Lacticaseibacillus rhamnosus]|uniref:aminotransferase-like domain-containing protein n=1 Tax=Lacticaseibacillus rhamnosus TaxID=47715 RepID=UPI0007DEC7C0|nr:PLP-dependent aminotransferase family protein [Lacticaseibacillus rhamnosus]MBB1166095.1 PLP-dependent aminotransferase family protein [Lacticaseibacillus rhamnosus]MCZ2731895.1 PLP-dependent aminotransferase family protein [Lacticaseibacillus rhamnosus]MCZ2734492.1 PLP-dependent aminotransferase family protein [Lacticaseibacillus rhamnosus]MCZ2740408.1 PLP-dependent aminotransferase family protein [Lacticaseibacillus rhamnosus]MCZ2743654.1 PLP-dependent aminotransferase family protein [Lac
MKFAKRTQKTGNSGLEDLFAASGPNVISFAGGYPDRSLFPTQQLNQAFKHSFNSGDTELLQYASTQGYLPLREKIAARLRATGIPTRADNIMMTQGAQQGLDLVARLMLDPGDGLVVEAPTYLGALAAFNAYQPTYYEIPMQDDGMDINALQRVLMSHKVKFIYTVPDFQNPTGVVMSVAKRQALIRLANQYDVMILEDNPYRDLRYDGKPLPTIKSFDTQGRVVYLGSFSKILSPSLRMGWLVAAPDLLQELLALKGGSDLESSNLTMHGIDAYMAENDLDAHITEIQNRYREKKNAMVAAMTRYLPDEAHFTNPDGGFFLWLTMPAGFDMGAFMKQHLLPESNISYVPSANLYATSAQVNGARLNFTGPTLEQIDTGIKALGDALKTALQHHLVAEQA